MLSSIKEIWILSLFMYKPTFARQTSSNVYLGKQDIDKILEFLFTNEPLHLNGAVISIVANGNLYGFQIFSYFCSLDSQATETYQTTCA